MRGLEPQRGAGVRHRPGWGALVAKVTDEAPRGIYAAQRASQPRLVPFQPEHLRRFRPGRFDRQAMAGVITNDAVRAYAGRAVSMVVEGRVLAIGGLVEVDGVIRAWVLASNEARERYPVFLHRAVRRMLRWIEETVGGARIEATVAHGFKASRCWIERLGFVPAEAQSEDGFVRYVRCLELHSQQ